LSEKLVVSRYEEYLRYEKDASENSIKAYLADIHLFLSFLEVSQETFNPRKVSKGDVRSWVMSMRESGVSPRSINRRITAVSGFFKWALSVNEATINPASMVKKMKEHRYIPSFIREDEMDKILSDTSVCDDEMDNPTEKYEKILTYTVILTLYSTGFRKSELLNLKKSDIDYTLKTIKITGKGNKQRIVPIIPELEDALRYYESSKKTLLNCINDDFFVFLWSDGGRLSYYHLLSMIKNVLRKEGVQGKLSPHLLRHTFATHLLRAGAEITAIKELLGHSSLVTTQVYTHNTIEELKEVYRNAHPRAKDR